MKKLGGLMFTLAAATLAHEASAADLNVCASGCPFPSIQSAINSSHAHDVIHIAAGIYFENLLVPNQRLTIVGAGQDLTVIDGRERGSVVTIGIQNDAVPQTVSIIGVTITHGNATYGGGIAVNTAALDLQNSIVSSNSASQNGGGLYVNSIGIQARVTGTAIVHNKAGNLGGGISVEAEAVAQISNSSVTRNTAVVRGGGLHAEGASTTTIQGSTVADNTSQDDGGGIYLETGLPRPSMTIDATSIVGNKAANGGGGLRNAGGRLTLGAQVVFGNNLPTDSL